MSMSLRLITAFALSLVLHGVLLVPDIMKRLSVAPPRPALQAILRLPPKPEKPPDEPLLKNTIDTEEAPKVVKSPAPAPVKPEQHALSKQEVRAAQRKVSQYVYYPPEAVAQGIEGEVRLILKLAADGTVVDVSIAASSGHPILDNAAIKAVYAMGKLSGATSRELILPVIFQLQ
ncbi:MAG: energy transducer TonB [Propionivibrio sp.]|nr:energy transducer TonB [Propionivibrio sp.]MBK8893384.1 energy transducer TonB [Propionivibrio sp.]